MNKRDIYLDNYTLDEAVMLYTNKLKSSINFRTLDIDVTDSIGYISAKEIYAVSSSPNYNASAMDGISTDYKLLESASEKNPTILNKDQYTIVDTGDVINKFHNCVVMIEDVVFINEGVKLIKPSSYFSHIRAIGEDISATQMIINKFHKIRTIDINTIIASHNSVINVFDKLNCLVIPTGDEIVSVDKKELCPGEIIDSNSAMINAQILDYGWRSEVSQVINDDYEILKKTLLTATKNYDVIFINAGSSAGSEDYTASVIEELGEVYVHGIAIKPGKPAILGKIDDTIVIGLPGYPVSSYIVFEKVVKKIFNKLFNQEEKSNYIYATLSNSIVSSLKHLEFVRVKVANIDNNYYAMSLGRGAGISSSIQECDGIIDVAKNLEGLEAGSSVKVELIKTRSEIDSNIFITGSHDLIIDIIKNIGNLNISSTHVGSYNGVISLKNKQCHIAPVHILENGKYNNLFHLFDEEIVIIKGVGRNQGLIVEKGNPKNIYSLSDLKNINYVNRQKGSGTALLFDELLKSENIPTSDINGYDFVASTHFNVASLVKNKTCDAGLGIYSVSEIFDLDFIFLANEEYDFITYKHNLDLPGVKAFIEVLKSEEFKTHINRLGGYDTSRSGMVVYDR